MGRAVGQYNVGGGPGDYPAALVQGALSSPPLPMQAIRRRNVRREDSGRKPERRRLKTARLKEYTIKSHSSMPPNNTYINFERFSKVLEEVAAAEEGLRGLEHSRRLFHEDLEALTAIYEEKEAWYREENESLVDKLLGTSKRDGQT